MKRTTRLLMVVALAALALLAAANIGVANPLSAATRQAPECTANPAQTFPCAVAGTTASSAEELIRICTANPMACGMAPGEQIKPCEPGKLPTLESPCIPAAGGGNGGAGGNGGNGGGMPNIDWANLADCAAGQLPTPQAPCKIDLPDCAAGQLPSMNAPCKPAPCPPGVKPTRNAPCLPPGQDGGFDAPPTTDIKKQLNNKFIVVTMDVEGSGDTNGSFDVTFKSVVSGVGKQTKAFLNEQLAGESFVISTTSATTCFADTTDPDKIPDLVSCNELDSAANNAPGSIKAQFRGKVTFDPATYQPTFKAKKIVFLKGVFNVAKIT
jgi:hypothetical protein